MDSFSSVHFVMEFLEIEFLVSDKRVANWFLMSSYMPTLLLTVMYLLSIYVGIALMKNREPFKFKYTLFFYNAGLVGLNLHIFYEV